MLNVTLSQSHSSKPEAVGASARSFVTISRQIGIRFPSLPQLVAQALSATASANQPAWSAWDREIIAKAVAEYDLPEQTVEYVEQSGYSWLDTSSVDWEGSPTILPLCIDCATRCDAWPHRVTWCWSGTAPCS